MFKHVFLILNYNTKNMTFDLANYILQQGCQVVIVDNASRDDSFDFLTQKFEGIDRVHIIKTETNVGFARGNNLGYKYIQDNITNFSYLHCINSDIQFEDFTRLIRKIEFDDDSFIIGPNVVHDNFRTSPLQVRNVSTIKEDNLADIKMYRSKILKHKVGRIFGRFYYNYMKKNNSFVQTSDFPHYRHLLSPNEYYVLNGCYLVFTSHYFSVYDTLFDPNTFLYCEEEILFYKMKIKNHKVSYYDDVMITHLEGASSVDSIIFKYQELKKSSEVFKKILGGE